MNTAAERELADERIVVIGGCSDIGITTARAVADHGGRAIVTREPSAPGREERHNTQNEHEHRTETETADAVDDRDENGLVAVGREHIEVYELDSTDETAVEAFFEDIGAFDHLVCAAAGVPTGGPSETDTETFRDVFDVVFWGSYHAAKHGVERLGEGDTITFVSGNAASRPAMQFSAMGAANAAVETLTKYLAVETGPVRVNAVSPGRVDALGLSEETRQSLTETLPAKRTGDPEDIADAILFVVTNPYTTGTVIRVDGGDLLV